jgi:hypothetical protein
VVGNNGKGGGEAMIVVLPLALGGIVATARGRLVQSARRVGSRRRSRPDAAAS